MLAAGIAGGVSKLISVVIDKVIPDANSRIAIKQDLLYQVQTVIEAQKDIILAEANGQEPIQRLWRPIVGWSFSLMCIFMVFMTGIVRPLLFFLTGIEMPELVVSPELWYAVFFCLGGYMSLRSIEKIARWLKIR